MRENDACLKVVGKRLSFDSNTVYVHYTVIIVSHEAEIVYVHLHSIGRFFKIVLECRGYRL